MRPTKSTFALLAALLLALLTLALSPAREGAKPARTLLVTPGDVPEGVVVMEAAEEF